MKKNLYLFAAKAAFVVAAMCMATNVLKAQNTFPSSGSAGIGVTDFSNTIPGFQRMLGLARGSAGVYGITFSDPGNGWTISLATEGSERLSVKDNGNVGIGTTSPYTKLDVTGNIYTALHRNTNLHDVTERGTYYIGSKSGNSDDGFAGMKTTVEAGAGGCGNGARISFQTWGCSISASRDVMTIDQRGNVGIGTTSPATKLEINNGSTNGAIKIVDGTQGQGKVLTSDANGVGTWVTPTPSAQVNMENSYIGIDAQANPRLALLKKSGCGPTIATDGSNDIIFAKLNTTITQANVSTGALFELIRIKNNGNVGIGTNSPSAKLDIYGNIKIMDGTQGAGKVLTSNADGVATWQTLASTLFPYNAQSTTYTLYPPATAPQNRGSDLMILAGPAAFSGSIAQWGGDLRLTGGDGYSYGYDRGGVVYIYGGHTHGPSGRITNNTMANVILAHDGTNSSGKVGIGTNSPNSMLDIGSDNATSTQNLLDVHGSAHFNNDLATTDATMTHVTINTDTVVNGCALTVAGPTYIGDWRDIETGKIKPDNLGAYYLWVKGGVVSEDYVVAPQADWRDYVFAPEYKLPALSEVESFIKTNRHLEGVPSESDVKQSGYNVASLSKVFLEKIEHLYLYSIAQEKKVNSLQEINTNLKKENERQQQLLSGLEQRIAALEKSQGK